MTPPLALVLVAALVLKVIGLPLTVRVSPLPKLGVSESVPAAPDKAVAPLIGSGAVAWLSITVPEVLAVPGVVVGAARLTGPLKPSAAKVAGSELVTERLVPALSFSVTTPPLLTVDGVVVPEIASIAERTSLMLLVADVDRQRAGCGRTGRAGCIERDRRAVDGEGIAGRKTGGQ